MSPSPTLLPYPCGSAPLKLTGAATSAAPSAATLSAHRRVSTPYPLSSVVSSAVLPPGHKSRSHCPLSALLRHRMRCGMCGVSFCGLAARKPKKIEAVAVLRLRVVQGLGSQIDADSEQAHALLGCEVDADRSIMEPEAGRDGVST